jgi:subtilase family serine protease
MDQNGGSSNPTTDEGWDVEQALDVDAVSAACPDCHILVVQATTSSFANLEAAVNRAAAQPGVVAISNSYGCRPGCTVPDNSAYNHPGIAVTASSGDIGFDGGSFPATDSKVVAVGGTSVTRDGSARGYHETAWSGAGSGCGNNPKPAWQNAVGTTCATKATADVSAAADPNLGGLVVYCGSVLSQCGSGGFIQVGGTSEASPIIAAVYALSGNTTGYPAKIAYNHPAKLFDITSGSNGSCGVPVCTARAGWDGPTGMGTPRGVLAF